MDNEILTLLDRVEFALRDAGFDYDEAFRCAYLAEYGIDPRWLCLTLRSSVSPDNDNVVGYFKDQRTAYLIGNLLLAVDKNDSPEYSHFTTDPSGDDHACDASCDAAVDKVFSSLK